MADYLPSKEGIFLTSQAGVVDHQRYTVPGGAVAYYAAVVAAVGEVGVDGAARDARALRDVVDRDALEGALAEQQ